MKGEAERELEAEEHELEELEEGFEIEREWLLLLALSLAGVIAYFAGYPLIATAVLALDGALLLARFAYYLFAKKRYTIDLIMGGVAVLLVAAGRPLEGLIIMALYGFAETLEELVERFAMRRVTAILEIVPKRVTVLRGSRQEVVDADDVKPGDVVLVGRGQVVPVDGVLLDKGVFNTSIVTGEPVPVEAGPGETVYSGYINLGDPVRVRALASPRDSSLQRVVRLALSLLERKSRVQRVLERYSPAYSVGLFTVAGLALLLWGVNGAVSVLVAGCPSAFIITSSVLSLYGVGGLARLGIVVKGGEAMERLGKVRVVVLDKTGTLTLGRPVLSRVIAPPGVNEERLLSVAASLAAASSHPLSRGIVEAARQRGVEIPSAAEVREIPGKGLIGRVDGYEVALGSASLVGARLAAGCGEGEASVYVRVDGGVGLLCFSDVVDESARDAVEKLKSMGVKVVIASGDRRVNVEKVARILGVEEYYGELKPEDKLRFVEDLRRRYGPVAMVGDGVNDVAAMAAADAGVAVGEVNVVIEVADAVLRGGIKQLPLLLKAARGFYSGIASGFTVAGLVKVAAIAGGITGFLPLWLVALIGDDGSTILGAASAVAVLTARLAAR